MKNGYVELIVHIHHTGGTLDSVLRAVYRALWAEFDLNLDGDLEVEAKYSAGLDFDKDTVTAISRLKAATKK